MNIFVTLMHSYPAVLSSRQSGQISDAIWINLLQCPRFADWLKHQK